MNEIKEKKGKIRFCDFCSDFSNPELEEYFHYIVPPINDMHTHNYFEIFLVTQGELIHEINGKRELLKRGSMRFIRPIDVHVFYLSDTSDVEPKIINLMYTKDRMQKLLETLGEQICAHCNASSLKMELTPEEFNLFFSWLNKYLARGDDFKASKEFYMHLWVYEFIKLYAFRNSLTFFSDIDSKKVGKKIEPYIKILENVDNFELSFSEVIADIPYSRVQLDRLFKQSFDKTALEYFVEKKLLYAKHLLSCTDMSILEVSSKIGYSSLSYFIRLFKKRFGYSPGKLKKGR